MLITGICKQRPVFLLREDPEHEVLGMWLPPDPDRMVVILTRRSETELACEYVLEVWGTSEGTLFARSSEIRGLVC